MKNHLAITILLIISSIFLVGFCCYPKVCEWCCHSDFPGQLTQLDIQYSDSIDK